MSCSPEALGGTGISMLQAWVPSPHSQHTHLLTVLKARFIHIQCTFLKNVHPVPSDAKICSSHYGLRVWVSPAPNITILHTEPDVWVSCLMTRRQLLLKNTKAVVVLGTAAMCSQGDTFVYCLAISLIKWLQCSNSLGELWE